MCVCQHPFTSTNDLQSDQKTQKHRILACHCHPTASPAPSARSVRLDISPQTSPRPASRYSKDGGLKTVNPYYYSVYSINNL